LQATESVALIRQFIEACVRAEPDEFSAYFTEDAIWWNAPWKAVKGRAAIRETMRRGAERMTALPWEIRHIVAEGSVSVPCMGIFELKDGKIAAWRDYWDLKQFEAQVASPPTGTITGEIYHQLS